MVEDGTMYKNTKTKIAAIAPSAMIRKWIQFHCGAYVYAAVYNACLNSITVTHRLLNERSRPSWISEYVSDMCTENSTRKPHMEYATTINYRILMTQKPFCPRESATTLNNISQQT